jgi:hypothetical protein
LGKAEYRINQKVNSKDVTERLNHGCPHAPLLIPLQGVAVEGAFDGKGCVLLMVSCPCGFFPSISSFAQAPFSASTLITKG